MQYDDPQIKDLVLMSEDGESLEELERRLAIQWLQGKLKAGESLESIQSQIKQKVADEKCQSSFFCRSYKAAIRFFRLVVNR